MGRMPCCEKEGVNRGAWTAMEDKILTDYISLHGQGNWRKLPINAGLKRCGKSCRLRWLNYLKPDIKRGNITREEEDLIIRLHKLLGNRWSLIAGRLPGRTDNEIKNYWNTNISKKLQGDNPKYPLHFHNQNKPRPSSTSLHHHDHHQKPPIPTSVVRTKATRLTKVVISEELRNIQQKNNMENPGKKPFEVTLDNMGSIGTLSESPQGVLEPGPTWALDESNSVDWMMDVDTDDHILSKDLEAHEFLLDTSWITSFLE